MTKPGIKNLRYQQMLEMVRYGTHLDKIACLYPHARFPDLPGAVDITKFLIEETRRVWPLNSKAVQNHTLTTPQGVRVNEMTALERA